MDDENPTTCLSSDPHDDHIKDHLIHFLGCLEVSERYGFLNNDDTVLWKKELKHQHKILGGGVEKPEMLEEAKIQTKRIRERWKSDCQSELRRIDFLRQKLEEDIGGDSHLVKEVEKSGKTWRASTEFKDGIKNVRAWKKIDSKSQPNAENLYDVKDVDWMSSKYESEKDINVPFMYLVRTDPADVNLTKANEEIKDGIPIWGEFPDQKTTVHHLLDKSLGEHNLLSRERLPEGVKYFHLPSNNMEWVEEAIARYYVQERPNFHASRREVQRQARSEAALILRESHWRGQFHGGRNTTNSRFMRPFCEAVSSSTNPKEAELVPQNLVLFMPYLHWETSRNRARFAVIIDDVVEKKRKNRRETEAQDKVARQKTREGLKRPTPKPVKEHSNRFQRLSKLFYIVLEKIGGKNHNENVHQTGGESGQTPLRVSTMNTLLRNLDLPRSQIKIDGKRRVTIPQSKLGQYLIDAARLYEGMASYRDKKLLESYLTNDPPLHPRRTLDQAYYWSLRTTQKRDKDQVVYRHTTPDQGSFHTYNNEKVEWEHHDRLPENQSCESCTTSIRKVSRVVMVDQLWMWILDSKTIITCFPKRYGANKHDSSGVHKSVRLRIGEGRYKHVKSIYDLALIVFEECSNTFFDRTRTSDKQPQVLDAFSEAIGNIMHKQTEGFERLWQWTEDARMYYRSPHDRPPSDIHVTLLDIKPEGELEKEIKDIVEELGIMIYVNKEHRDVLKQFVTHVTHILDPLDQFQTSLNDSSLFRSAVDARKTPNETPFGSPYIEIKDPMASVEERRTAAEMFKKKRDTYKWFKVNADELLIRVNGRIEQLEELERSANATASSVKDLLDLKSQQAGVFQAWQAMKQSEETTRQGTSIMIFTVVTIVFLPLSFMSSVFGMNAKEFSDDDGNTMTISDQITYMLGVSSSVIALTFLFSLSSWVRSAVWYVYKRATTALFVHTKLYQRYLDIQKPSSELRLEARTKTEKLKKREREARLVRRAEKATEKEIRGINGNFAQNGVVDTVGDNPFARTKWWDRMGDEENGGCR
ncbi:hypothetical protein BKA67DRAFT_660747 [Truncatella angustata]|uniref:Ankyrin repeat protein n=1 Tax=Truncatella angustata TaxID=152316 RepID=A0A9P8UH21_9PEZI|nr:uncharacterized protein BKA67DRAFT_660747 [Truncatella angustata]KAH6651973.1 hypothetical protein BKA67DRAFT_660747 [Truncatella angustata]KAH8205696.1 hypothetical protein TruAng_000190 [Truncatella angustata]